MIDAPPSTTSLFIVHSVRGRIRLAFPAWDGRAPEQIEERLRAARGIQSATANSLTRRILVKYDPMQADAETVLIAVRALLTHPPASDPGPHDEVDESTAGMFLMRRMRAVTPMDPIPPASSQARSTALLVDRWLQVGAHPERRARDVTGHWSMRATARASTQGKVVLRAISIVLGLLQTGSPLGLVLSVLEALELLSSLGDRWATTDSYCARCGQPV
jgi:hypothetical protein